MNRLLKWALLTICFLFFYTAYAPSVSAAPTTWTTLNGNNQYFDAGDPAPINALTNKMTIEAWVRFRDVTQQQTLVSKAQGSSFSLEYNVGQHTNKFRIALHINGTYVYAASTSAATANQWVHVAATYNGSSLALLVNGVQEGSTAVTGNITPSSVPLFFGQNPPADAFFFDGDIGEVRIWNVARTQAQIQAGLDAALAGTETGLIGLWKFDQATTGTVYDKTATNADATGKNYTPFTGTASANQTSVDFTLTNVTGVNETNEIRRGSTVEYSALNGTSYRDLYLAPGTSYSYVYQAKTGNGLSAPRTLNVTTNSLPPPANSLRFSNTPYIAADNVNVNTAAGTSNTVEFWMKWDGAQAPTQMPFSWSISPYYSLYINYYVEYGYFGISTRPGTSLGFPFAEYAGKWVHVAAVMPNGVAPDATNAKIYLNGELQPLKLQDPAKPTNATNATKRVTMGAVGEPSNPSGYAFAGQLAEWKIWRGERTAAEIGADATTAPTGTEPTLAGYWRPDAITTAKVYDLSTGKHDAVSYSFPDVLNLNTTSLQKNQVVLGWNATPGALSPLTYRLAENGTQIFTGSTGTSYTRNGVLANEPYGYSLQASNANGESTVSSISLTTPRGIADVSVPATIGFPGITLSGAPQSVSAAIPALTVTEENGDGFILQVQASPFRAVSNPSLTLPAGSLRMSKPASVTLQSGRMTAAPLLYGPFSIDAGTVANVVESAAGNIKGTVSLTFPANALQLSLNPATTRTDPARGASPTMYSADISWTLVVGSP